MNIHNKITNGFLWIVCLSIGWTSCSEKTDALHFNEAEQVFEISKLSELHFLSKLTEDNPLLIDVNLKTKTGKEIPATQARIKLINDIEISGKWTPINAPIKELNGNGHTIIFDDVEFIVEDSEKSFFYYFGLFGELGTEENAIVKNLTLTGDIFVKSKKKSKYYSLVVGALAGGFKGGTIENCINKTNIHIYNQRGLAKIWLGGLMGGIDNYHDTGTFLHGKIQNEGNLTIEQCAEANTGGIAGWVFDLNDITINKNVQVKNKGNISVLWANRAPESSNNAVGGVFGNFTIPGGDVEHLHNSGNISLDTQGTAITLEVGGVCGCLEHQDYSKYMYATDLYNSGTIEIRGGIINKLSCVGGIAGSFGGCSFHQAINKGQILLPKINNGKVGGLLGEESRIKGNCYLYSCCKDLATTHPIWNTVISGKNSRLKCKDNH